MLISKLCGGMGNQMFQYAAALTQSLRLQVELQLDASGVGRHTYQLGQWSGVNSTVAKTTKTTTVSEADTSYHSLGEIVDGDVIQGYWQSEKYFGSIRKLLLRNFVPFPKTDGRFYEFHNQILHDENSVAVHIRRGDYTKPGTKEYHGLLGLDYYERALLYLKGVVEHPSVYMFTDDPGWVQVNYRLSNFQYVDVHQEASNIFLMSQCRHHIIANSSFSWWGAWLGEVNNHIVVAPERWFDQGPKDTQDIVPDWWVKL
jgi:hypothetical protein